MEKIPCEEKDDKDISKLVSGIVKCSISRQISYKTVGPNEVLFLFVLTLLTGNKPLIMWGEGWAEVDLLWQTASLMADNCFASSVWSLKPPLHVYMKRNPILAQSWRPGGLWRRAGAFPHNTQRIPVLLTRIIQCVCPRCSSLSTEKWRSPVVVTVNI